MTRKVFLKAMLAVVVVFGLLIFPSDLAAQGNSNAAFNRVKEVQERHTDALMARTGVVGTAIGLGQGGRPVMLVLLEKGGVAIPTSLEGVLVRPLVTGKIYGINKPVNGQHDHGDEGGEDPPPDLTPTDRWPRPVPIGVSTGHPDITAGTIGCRVTDGTDVYALSNNHVYANQNLASIGDDVIQPGAFDLLPALPNDDDVIGTLAAFVPIDFYDPTDPDHIIVDNTMDAAIVLSTTGDLGKATPSDGYGTPKSEIIGASINQKVKKYGRTTESTKGLVAGLNAVVTVQYDLAGEHLARFVNQIVITPGSFSGGGDSGSLIVVDGKGKNKADDGKPVGLLFAGSAFSTIANPIGAVLDGLSLALGGPVDLLDIDGE